MKRLIITLIVIGVLGLGGTAYWYLAIYQPAEYAKAFIQLDERMKASGREVDRASTIKDPKDYTGALAAIQQSQNLIGEFQEQLSSLNPPFFGEGKQIHEDASKLLGYMSIMINDAEQRALFFIQAKELHELLKTDPGQQKFTNIGEMTKFIEDLVGQIKTKGEELFQKEPFQLGGEISHDQLEAAWEQGEPALDAIVEFLRSQDPNLSVDEIRLSPEAEAIDKSNKKFDEFKRLLKAALDENGANDILSFRATDSFRFSDDVSQEEEMNKLDSRTKDALKNLKTKYSE